VRDAAVGQQFSRPLLARIARKHVEPDRVHTQRGAAIFVKQYVLRPPGAGDTCRSRGRDEKYEAREAGVGIEPGAEFGEVVKIDERRRRGLRRRSGLRRRRWGGDRNDRQGHRRQHERVACES